MATKSNAFNAKYSITATLQRSDTFQHILATHDFTNMSGHRASYGRKDPLQAGYLREPTGPTAFASMTFCQFSLAHFFASDVQNNAVPCCIGFADPNGASYPIPWNSVNRQCPAYILCTSEANFGHLRSPNFLAHLPIGSSQCSYWSKLRSCNAAASEGSSPTARRSTLQVDVAVAFPSEYAEKMLETWIP